MLKDKIESLLKEVAELQGIGHVGQLELLVCGETIVESVEIAVGIFRKLMLVDMCEIPCPTKPPEDVLLHLLL